MLTDHEKQGKQQWSPFVGPRPFKRDSEDQKIFFGRDDESEQILSLIYAHPLVLIYAQSGAGKTSILNAQVTPELEKNGFEVLPTARVGIGSRDDTKGKYNTTKTVAVHDDGGDGSSHKAVNPYILNTLQSLAPELQDSSLLNSKSLSEFLHDQFPHKINQRRKPIPQVIMFDQLEELFSLYSDPNRWREQQQAFFKQVADALDGDSLLRVVFVIREDYLAKLDPFAYFLPERLKARFRLERLHKDAAFEAVKGPLEEAKLYIDGKLIDKLFDERIIDKLIEDLLNIRVETFGGKSREIKGEFVEPIQLQVVCQRLWNKLKISQIDQITQDNFAYLGDVDKALEDFYVEAIVEASKQTGIGEDAIRNWFEQNLITTSGTRGIVHRGFESTGGIANKAVDILEKKYLIRKEERSGAQWYELTHDRLIKPIKDSNEKWKRGQEVTIRITPIILAKRRLVNGMRKAFPSKQSIAFIAVIITLAFFALLPYIHIGNEPCTKTSDLQLRTGGFPDDVAINENTNTIYMTTHPSFPNDPSTRVLDCTKYDGFKEGIVEKGASKIAIDPKTNLIYVANAGNNTVSVIKDDASDKMLAFLKRLGFPIPTNLHILKNIEVSNLPLGIAVNPNTNKIYVANAGSNTVSVIDADSSNPHILKNMPVGNRPHGLVVDPNTNKVYVANTGSNTVSVIDGNSNNVTNINVEKAPFAISIDDKTKKVFVANRDNDTLSIIDGGDSKRYNVLNSILVGKTPIDIAVDDITDSDRSYIYVANEGSLTVSIIDGKTNDVIRTIPLKFSPRSIAIDRHSDMMYINSLDLTVGGLLEGRESDVPNYPKYVQVGNDPQHLAVNPATNKIYVANTGSNTVSVIDGKTNDVTRVIKLNGKQPSGIAVNPATNKIYVANTGSNSVSVIKDDGGSNLHNITNLKVGIKPNAVAVNPNTNKIYVANTGNNTVSVIDGKTGNDSTIKTISIGKTYITDLAVNPNTNKIYVANTGSNTVSVIDGKTGNITNVGPLPFYIDEASTLTVYPKTNMVYIVGSLPNQFSVIDGITDKIVRVSENQGQVNNTNSLTGGPAILAFNPKNDTFPEMYVANKYFGNIFIINKTNDFPNLIGANEIRGSPSDIAFANNLIYVVNKDYNTITVIQPIIIR